jgi:hypothetical protein
MRSESKTYSENCMCFKNEIAIIQL